MVVGTFKTNRQDIYRIVQESPVWDVFVTGAILTTEPDEIGTRRCGMGGGLWWVWM